MLPAAGGKIVLSSLLSFKIPGRMSMRSTGMQAAAI